MGTFDESKKLFPPAKADHEPEKPKDKPQPLGLGRAMQFNGVVGRSSLPIATTLTNPNHKPVQFDTRVSGGDFRVASPNEEIDKVQSGDNTAAVSIQYVPTKPGETRGRLHITSWFAEEPAGDRGLATQQELELTGTATALEHAKPAPADGSPRVIPDLEAEDKHLAPREQIKNDLDGLSGLAETYQQIVGRGDDAMGEMIRHIYHAQFEFETQIRQWVQAELSVNKISEAPPALKVAWKALGKAVGAGLDKLEMGSVVGLVVGHVVDAGLDRLGEYIGADHEAKGKGDAANSATEGGTALIATADATVKRRLGVLIGRINRARAEAGQLAGTSAMLREDEAQKALATGFPHEEQSVASHVALFKDALNHYSNAVRALAATSTQIETSLSASFDSLRMQYMKERATKSSDLTYDVEYGVAWDDGSDGNNGRETFRVFDPKISGVERVSEPMRDFITHRKLSDYAADANVIVRVECKQGGYVIIEKKQGGEPTFKDLAGIAAVRATMRGAQGFWNVLEEQIG